MLCVRMSACQLAQRNDFIFWRYYNVTLTLHVFVTFIIFQNALYFTEHILVPINPLFYKYVCIRYYISKDLRISQGTCLLPLNSFKLMQRNSAISEIQLRLIHKHETHVFTRWCTNAGFCLFVQFSLDNSNELKYRQ